MKNLDLLPEDLQDNVRFARWTCGCGQDDLRVSVTRKGTVQAHCYSCGRTLFFNEPAIFLNDDPWSVFKKETPVVKPMKNGGSTSWYPKCRVRVFRPAQ